MENEEVLATLDQEVAAIMDSEKAPEAMAKVKELIYSDAEVAAMMEKAESPEDMYEVFKRFVSMPLEAFKKLCNSVMDYFKNDKVELADETMDAVVGGWSFSNFWNTYKRDILVGAAFIAAIGLCCTGAGAALGTLLVASTATSTGALVGGLVGAVVGVGGSTAIVVAGQASK